ncbi:response regulator transcription factor [Arabiibacter massiliensis]|uniref:response regulator transcription factor n=1 Tax=Arabiibacter massiliensis TaxID=1870985 RepID=UPI0009BA17AD|nr:response regulator transcription factor [Arabiibacter massiliensis]
MGELARILVIEDDTDINDVVATSLTKAGYACTQAFSGSEARLLLANGAAAGGAPFDLVITDLMLPGASGEDLVREIRARSDAPIIVVSARTAPGDKVELLKLGADDYLAKPFDLDELHARVAVQLRHAARGTSRTTATLRFKDWVLDTEARTLVAAGTPVKLTRLEYGIVEALVRRPKKVFTKQELFQAAWNEECVVEEKAVNVHMSNIRGKLKPTGTDGYLETVWGIGFKLAE